MNAYRVVRAAGVPLLALVLASAGCRAVGNWLQGEPQSIRQWEAAEALFQDERYAQAAVAYRAWLADYRDSEDVLRPFVLYRLGESYRFTRDYARATDAYTLLIRTYADSPNPEVKQLVDEVAKPRLDDIKPKTTLGQTATEDPGQKKSN